MGRSSEKLDDERKMVQKKINKCQSWEWKFNQFENLFCSAIKYLFIDRSFDWVARCILTGHGRMERWREIRKCLSKVSDCFFKLIWYSKWTQFPPLRHIKFKFYPFSVTQIVTHRRKTSMSFERRTSNYGKMGGEKKFFSSILDLFL